MIARFFSPNTPQNSSQLIVHIGTTKTGSSSIQKFLDLNRDRLRSEGILVPQCFGRLIHIKSVIAALPYGESPDLARTVPVSGWREHMAFRRDIRTRFQAEIADAPDCRQVLITAEHLQSRMTRADHVMTFRKLFCRGFAQVRIVVYVRPQLDHIVSLYSTMLRNGYRHPLEEFIASRMQAKFRDYFDLQKLIARWGQVFGAENIILRPYTGIHHQTGTLGDFCQIMGIDPDGWRMPARANTGINVTGQQMLLALNQQADVTPDQRRAAARQAETEHAGHGAMPSLAMAQSFQSLFEEGNAWVIRTYFPDHPEYLQPRWPKS